MEGVYRNKGHQHKQQYRTQFPDLFVLPGRTYSLLGLGGETGKAAARPAKEIVVMAANSISDMD